MVISQMLERPKLAASTHGIPHTLGIFLTPKLPLVKCSCKFFAVTQQNHYLCEEFVRQLL